MSDFFVCHWRNIYWNPRHNRDGEKLRLAGSNRFAARGVSSGQGQSVYVVTIIDGQLYLGGRLRVSQLVSRKEALKRFPDKSLFPAREWVVDDQGGTRLHLARRLAPEVSRLISCVTLTGKESPLLFVDRSHLDGQTTRGIRRLTVESARLLDRILKVTDRMPRNGDVLTVTKAMLEAPDGVPR